MDTYFIFSNYAATLQLKIFYDKVSWRFSEYLKIVRHLQGKVHARRCTCKLHLYRRIFNNEFYLAVHRPRKESCLQCDKYKHDWLDEDECHEHMLRKEAASENKINNTEEGYILLSMHE